MLVLCLIWVNPMLRSMPANPKLDRSIQDHQRIQVLSSLRVTATPLNLGLIVQKTAAVMANPVARQAAGNTYAQPKARLNASSMKPTSVVAVKNSMTAPGNPEKPAVRTAAERSSAMQTLQRPSALMIILAMCAGVVPLASLQTPSNVWTIQTASTPTTPALTMETAIRDTPAHPVGFVEHPVSKMKTTHSPDDFAPQEVLAQAV